MGSHLFINQLNPPRWLWTQTDILICQTLTSLRAMLKVYPHSCWIPAEDGWNVIGDSLSLSLIPLSIWIANGHQEVVMETDFRERTWWYMWNWEQPPSSERCKCEGLHAPPSVDTVLVYLRGEGITCSSPLIHPAGWGSFTHCAADNLGFVSLTVCSLLCY